MEQTDLSHPAPADGPRVAVVGASGHTGAFVVDELARRGLVPIAIGRDPGRLAARGFAARGVEARVAAVDDPASLDTALAGVAAVVSCAGPFLDTADAVVAAALRAGAHYVDVTAEQASAMATLARFDGPAREAGVVVVPAMGFYGGLADLLCRAATGDRDHADEVRVGIGLDSWWPTEGTRATGRRNTGPRFVIESGASVALEDPAPRITLELPAPFGAQPATAVALTEVPLIARHLAVGRLRTWLTDTALRDLRDPATPPPMAADDSGRSAQSFLVEVVVRGPYGTRRATAAGRDIYAVTAPLVGEAVDRILDGRVAGPGALAPGQAFDAPSFLRALEPAHLALTLAEASPEGPIETARGRSRPIETDRDRAGSPPTGAEGEGRRRLAPVASAP